MAGPLLPLDGDDTTADELLAMLLQEDTDVLTTAMVPTSVPTQPVCRTAVVTTSTSTERPPPPQPPIKRKRKRERVKNYRPKEEIDRLRRAVADLEDLLALTRQRSRTGRIASLLAVDHAEYSPSETTWMDVATRQYKYMRESQVLNDHLRAQLLSQIQVVRGLTRLAQRAWCGIPSELIPRGVVDTNAASFTSKRQELIGFAAAMYDSIEKVLTSEPFQSTTEELSDSTTYRYEDFLIPRGAPLARGCVRRYAPHSVTRIATLMWALDTPSARGRETFRVEHLEQDADRQVVQGTIRIAGTSEAKCVIVRRLRVWGSTRRSIVFASSLWPSATSRSPWNVVGMDTKQWIDVRDSPTLCDGERLTEVRTTMKAYKLMDTPLSMTPCEATRLQGFVTKPVEFSMNYLQHKLDGMLLGLSKNLLDES